MRGISKTLQKARKRQQEAREQHEKDNRMLVECLTGVTKKKNIYLCHSCGHGYVTQDGDASCTPFASKCLNPDCDDIAYSMFYSAPQEMLADITPAFTWTKERMGEK